MMNLFGSYFLPALIAVGALFTVRSRNLVRAVMWLAFTLLGTAGLYAQWNEPFLAGVQVLTYVGGVVTLMIFGVMVTRRHQSSVAFADVDSDEKGAIAGLALWALLWMSIARTTFDSGRSQPVASVEQVALALLSEHLLAFELLSLLLLAAIIGAVVLARRADPVYEHNASAQPVSFSTQEPL